MNTTNNKHLRWQSKRTLQKKLDDDFMTNPHAKTTGFMVYFRDHTHAIESVYDSRTSLSLFLNNAPKTMNNIARSITYHFCNSSHATVWSWYSVTRDVPLQIRVRIARILWELETPATRAMYNKYSTMRNIHNNTCDAGASAE